MDCGGGEGAGWGGPRCPGLRAGGCCPSALVALPCGRPSPAAGASRLCSPPPLSCSCHPLACPPARTQTRFHAGAQDFTFRFSHAVAQLLTRLGTRRCTWDTPTRESNGMPLLRGSAALYTACLMKFFECRTAHGIPTCSHTKAQLKACTDGFALCRSERN